MTFHIRPACLEDIPAITHIYAREVREGTATFELDPPDVSEMSLRYEALQKGHYPYFVAQWEGEIAGYAYASAFRPRPAYRFTVENSIYIAPTYQRRGIGTALMHALIAQSTCQGFRQMIAVIGDSRSLGSLRLHASLGFSHTATLPSTGFKLGGWRDTVLMQRALGEGNSTFPE
jgi:L-amino acid N-acyltransferase YncA